MTDIRSVEIDRILNSKQGKKPLDFAKGKYFGGIGLNGGLHSFFSYHSRHGVVGLTSFPKFNNQKRYDQKAVRKYRHGLAKQPGFGPVFDKEIINMQYRLLAGCIPNVRIFFADGSTAETTVVATVYGLIQRWILPKPTIFKGQIRLSRAEYTQLTEGGPLEELKSQHEYYFEGESILIEDENVGAYLNINGFPQHLLMSNQKHGVEVEGLIKDGESFFSYAFGESKGECEKTSSLLSVYRDSTLFESLIEEERRYWLSIFGESPRDHLYTRGIVYSKMMCIPVNEEASCIITDHMLLPLSWNRDSYYSAIALLDCHERFYPDVKAHLIWLFEVANRNQHEWGRCYLVNGDVKDSAYQLDQQLYPILELADYVETSRDFALLYRLKTQVDKTLEAIWKRKHEHFYLFPTEETPGDDPLPYKYHFSTHVLMWFTFIRLAKLLGDENLALKAERVREDTFFYFSTQYEDKKIFSYATNADKKYYLYHDANDVPLALAPIWGFVAPDDEVWLETVKFAFSPDNKGGYYRSNRLGSVHTPSPWPLGDIQKKLIGLITKNKRMVDQAENEIRQTYQWDGSLPEAYCEENLSVKSRHWFAWPNAFYSLVQNLVEVKPSIKLEIDNVPK